MSYVEGFKEVFNSIVIIAGVAVTGFFILLFIAVFSQKNIESKKLIKPEIKLEINNNKVDTVYVYKYYER